MSRAERLIRHESEFEYYETGPATARTAKQIYGSQTKVKPLVDADFWNIFYDRNKVVVVAFWSDSCRSCAEAAAVVTSLADRFSKGPTGPVKFYHVEWDPRVNPRVHQRFGFRSVPVVFFYYTGTGQPPTQAAPLLEGSVGYDESHEPNRYVRTIEAILGRHAPAKTVSVSQRRGWTHSRALVSKEDFADIDRILIAPSPFQQYFLQQFRANPDLRFSKRALVQSDSTFASTYQRIYGRLPGADEGGTVDRLTHKAYLRSVNNQLQTPLVRAIHEAVHMFCCPITGSLASFYTLYGFGITEGFTQFITEAILKSQKVRSLEPFPYEHELAVVTHLTTTVGTKAVADDYFLCTRRVYEELQRTSSYSAFSILYREADAQRKQGHRGGMIEAYKKLIRFLDAIK